MMASSEEYNSNLVKDDVICCNSSSSSSPTSDSNRSVPTDGGVGGEVDNNTNKSCVRGGELHNKADQLPQGFMLKKALVIFRHGARTPIHVIPNIPQATYDLSNMMGDMAGTVFGYNVVDAKSKGPRPYSGADASYSAVVLKGGSTSGQLTLLGQQGTYNLGQALKKDYVDRHKLIDQEYNKDHIFVKSTNMNRTVKSLICVMSGLFGSESLERNAPVQIPVADETYEVLIPNPAFCPNLQVYHMLAQKNAELESGTLRDRLMVEKILGMDSTKHQLKWIETRDDLIARQAHKLEIPKELEPHLGMIDKNATMQIYNALCGQTEKDTQTACMLSCGKAIHMFLDHLQKDSQDGNYKLYLYSCHDSTLTALLGAFNIFDNKWPPFAADLRIELYEDKRGRQFVRVAYLNKGVISRGCTEIYTPYETFVKGISPLAVNRDSHTAACNCKEIHKKAQGNHTNNEVTADDNQTPTKALGL